MILFKKIPAVINQTEYEVRIYHEPGIISVIVFSNNHPATGLRHQIKISKNLDIDKLLHRDDVIEVIDEFVQIAKEDIICSRWQRFLTAMKE